MNSKALLEIKEMFDKYNISIQIVYNNKLSVGRCEPELCMYFEDESGLGLELDHFWEDKIKAYNLIPFAV